MVYEERVGKAVQRETAPKIDLNTSAGRNRVLGLDSNWCLGSVCQ